jgi:MFS family permease
MDAGRNIRGFSHATKTYFQECFGNSYYWWYFGAVTVGGLAMGPVNLYSVFFAKSVRMDMATFGNCLALTYCFSLCLAYPLGWLADRFHPLRIAIGALILYAIVALWGGLFARDSRMLAIALVAHGVVAGIWQTGTASIGQRLLPKAEFGQFGSAGGAISNVAWMMLAPLAGLFLDHVVHHDYRYTYLIGFCLTIAGLFGFFVLHSKFMALGGPEYYVAPESITPGRSSRKGPLP